MNENDLRRDDTPAAAAPVTARQLAKRAYAPAVRTGVKAGARHLDPICPPRG